MMITGRDAAAGGMSYRPDGWRAEPASPAEVAALELAWTGVDRSDDHLAWARRPGGAALLARRGGQVMAGGTAGGGAVPGAGLNAAAPLTAARRDVRVPFFGLN
jgi:hypothetical protein